MPQNNSKPRKSFKKRQDKELSVEKRAKILGQLADRESSHTSRKMLSLLQASQDAKEAEVQQEAALAQQKKVEKRKIEVKATQNSFVRPEKFIPANDAFSDLLSYDICMAMDILRGESTERGKFMTVDNFDPFAAVVSLLVEAAPPVEETHEKDTQVTTEKVVHPEELAFPHTPLSIIDRWKASQKPLAVTTEQEDALGPDRRPLAQTCLQELTAANPPFALIKPEDFDDLLDPVGFGETNDRPPAFQAVPQKTAKMLPFHRMSIAKRQQLRPDG